MVTKHRRIVAVLAVLVVVTAKHVAMVMTAEALSAKTAFANESTER